MRDVNDIGFRLVFGPRDWTQRMTAVDPSDDGDVVWDAAAHVVRLRSKTVRFPRPKEATPWTPSDRRGAARDRYGSWYAITDDRTGIRVRPGGVRGEERFWPTDDPAGHASQEASNDASAGDFRPASPSTGPSPALLRGLAITTRHFLIAGTLDPAGLLVFDLHGGGPPQLLQWPFPFAPFDVAPRPGGGVWILDRPADGSDAARLWTLDRAFRVVAPAGTARVGAPGESGADFRPLSESSGDTSGEASHAAPGWMTLELTDALAFDLGSPAGDPIAIEALPDDTVLVLRIDDSGAEPASTVTRYVPLDARDPERGTTSLSDAVADVFVDTSGDPSSGAPTWQAHDLAVDVERATPPPVRATLYAVGTGGAQALAFDLVARSDDLHLDLRPQYIPLRRFGGRGLVAAGDTVHYDSGTRWLPLAVQPRTRYVSGGRIVTQKPFDGDAPGVVWHRVFLDGCIPPDASVQIESRAADDPQFLTSEPWQSEPAPYLRPTGSELPYDDPYAHDGEDPSPGTGTWEVLLQRAEGRYLQLRITLRGNGRTTPRLSALRVYAPRFSYLTEYLPDVYQNDPTSADFLDRFLANPEGVFTALEGRIAEVQQLFDTRTIPADYLGWLGGWLGATFDADLDATRRRLFLDHAMQLYRQRGTVRGLLKLIRLALHPCPDASIFEDPPAGRSGRPGTQVAGFDVRIVEAFRTRSQASVRFGDLTEPLQPRLTPRSETWTPAQGGAVLNERFRTFLDRRYEDTAARDATWPDDRFPTVLPDDPAQQADWRRFVEREISFPYAEIESDDPRAVTRFNDFLKRRYDAATIQARYGQAPGAVPLPRRLPDSGERLTDWIQFASFVAPIARAAHRFSVLVPALPGEAEATQSRRVDLVRRIVDRERPAHTAFTVQPYWALFRVGAVRVDYDTVLGESSRYAAIVLDDTDLADGVLAPAHPFGVADRRVTGRDTPSSATPL